MTQARRAYFHATPESMPTHYSEGIIAIFASRLATEHLWQAPYRGLQEYRRVMAHALAVIEERAAADSPYAWEWTTAQVRVIRHARYTPPRYTPHSWRGQQRHAL